VRRRWQRLMEKQEEDPQRLAEHHSPRYGRSARAVHMALELQAWMDARVPDRDKQPDVRFLRVFFPYACPTSPPPSLRDFMDFPHPFPPSSPPPSTL